MELSCDNKRVLILNCPFSYEFCLPNTEIGAKLNDEIMNFSLLFSLLAVTYAIVRGKV